MIKLYSAKITDFSQADYTNQYSLLSVALRQKIDAKKNVFDKQRSIAGYILLYRAVLQNFGKKNIEITFNKNGKPLCDFCFFSISHSDDRVVCVVSNNPIGVDIQKIVNIKFRCKYKFFNIQENAYTNEFADLLSTRFTEIFTKKEATIKMLGGSMSIANSIDTFSKKFNFDTQIDGDFIITVCTESKI